MYLRNLSITQFKNIGFSDTSFSSSLNCFVGYNGSGKTNILDAIYYLSLTKSATMTTDGRCVMHDQDFFILKGHYQGHHNDNPQSVTVSYQPQKGKKVMFANKEYPRISEHIGRFPLVMITPSESVLISDSAEYRRKFINTFFSQIDGEYLTAMMKYNGLLSQRNALLKTSGVNITMLNIYTEQLSEVAGLIYGLRDKYIKDLAPIVMEYYGIISGGREQIEVEYSSKLHEGTMMELLSERIDKDIARGYTTVGVHRDDVIFKMDGHQIRAFGSQGQQKSLLIAIKLAEAKFTSQKSGKKAILLLDDVFDKLDQTRVKNLVGLVSGEEFGQIFITDASKTKLGSIIEQFDADYKIFEVDGGEIIEQSKLTVDE